VIDIHHHCLPGIDDGPADWDAAVEQLRIATDEGIDTVIATPHVLRGPWQNDSPRELQKLVMELNRRVGGSPKVLLGSEYYFSHDVLEMLEGPIVPLAGSRYVLLEFASMSIPPRTENVLWEMALREWTPIIAHPERNLVFQQKLGLLETLIRHGARVQLTASSLEGAFGASAKKAAFAMLDREMVHFIATDAHSTSRRPPTIRTVRTFVETRWGADRNRLLFEDNPRAVVEQMPLPYAPEPRTFAQPTGLWGRLAARLMR